MLSAILFGLVIYFLIKGGIDILYLIFFHKDK